MSVVEEEVFSQPCHNFFSSLKYFRTYIERKKGNRLSYKDKRFPFGAPSGIRTRDTLIKSQVLYQLS